MGETEGLKDDRIIKMTTKNNSNTHLSHKLDGTQVFLSSRHLLSKEDDEEDDNTENSGSSRNDSLFLFDSCVPISQCELCHGGKGSEHAGCSDTGKRIKMKCQSSSGSSSGDSEEATLFTSCNRTQMDEEYLLVSIF